MPDSTTGEPRDPRKEEVTPEQEEQESEDHPRGTLFLMLIFLMILVALWGYVYLDMIRGGS
jgi:uncharacterized protein YqhQ